MLFKNVKDGEFFYRQGRYYIKLNREEFSSCRFNVICIKTYKENILPGEGMDYAPDDEVNPCTLKDIFNDTKGKIKFKDLKIGTRFTYGYWGECVKIKETFERDFGKNVKVNVLRLSDGVLHSMNDNEFIEIKDE